jgi:ubiquinone/menaquinone biosynthesis C-methylase UbiE
MYTAIISCLKRNNLLPITGKILGISGIDNFYILIDRTNAQLEQTSYPEVDMQNMPYNDNTFDFVISDQILEHLEDPPTAINESYRVLKPGGIVIHTTCFLNYLHFFPQDLWRLSPDALRYICRHFSEILISKGWGNRFAIVLCFISNKFRFMKIPETKWSIKRLIATYNEHHYPIVTWIIARK